MKPARHCDLCENKMTSLEKGVTCKLTSKKPDFNNTCSKIDLGKKFQKKLEIANLELEILRRNKKSTHLTFYGTIIIGFLLILLGYFFSNWKIFSLHLWYVKIGQKTKQLMPISLTIKVKKRLIFKRKKIIFLEK